MENYEKKYKDALDWMKALYQVLPNAIKEDAEHYFPELKESNDEKIRKALCEMVYDFTGDSLWIDYNVHKEEALAWLEKQKPTEPFKAEHSKYYYCIKDYYSGGNKRASKGDVVQALNGLSIMGLKDASEYFLPVKKIEQKSAKYSNKNLDAVLSYIKDETLKNWLISQIKLAKWSEEDESMLTRCIGILGKCYMGELPTKVEEELEWIKSLKERCISKPKQGWSEEDEKKKSELISFMLMNIPDKWKEYADWLESLCSNHNDKNNKVYKFKGYLARDADSTLYLYLGNKPIKYDDSHMWIRNVDSSSTAFLNLDFLGDIYPEIKWTDKEPVEIEFTLNKI